MGKVCRRLSFVLLVLALGPAVSCTPRANGPGGVDVAAPQRYVRIHAGADGASHFADWAFERGSNVAHIRPKGTEEAVTVRGKHLNILRRQPDGSWRIARRMRNRDHPAARNTREEERRVRDDY